VCVSAHQGVGTVQDRCVGTGRECVCRHTRVSAQYKIGVSAQDVSVKTLQRSPTHSLKIFVGERDPQFFETQYVASVPETEVAQFQ